MADKKKAEVKGHCSHLSGLTQQNNDAEQNGHQSSSRETIWEGQDLRVARLHVSTAVTATHTHNEGTRAALDGVVVVRDHYWQEVHAHLTAAETSPPCQDIGGVVCGTLWDSQAQKLCSWAMHQVCHVSPFRFEGFGSIIGRWFRKKIRSYLLCQRL